MLQRKRGSVVGWGLFLSLPGLTSCFPTPVEGGRYPARPADTESTRTSQSPPSVTPFDKRQLEIDGPFTFTIPLPAPTPTNQNTSPLPLLLSPYFPYVSTKSTVSSLPTSTINPTSSISIPSATINPNAKSNANNDSSTPQPRLTATTFLPFILLTSIFLIALIGWCLHGWCTRRPKIHSSDKTAGSSEERRRGWFSFTGREGEDLVSGPKYVGSGHNKDLGYGYLSGRERTERFKWPSISLAERQGYRYRLSPEDDEREASPNPVPLNASPAVTDKLKRNPPSASTVGITSPTSIALKELYDAVLKSGLSSPASELRRECDEWRKGEEEEKTPLLGLVSASGSGVHLTNQIMSGQKRRGHVRRDSSDDLLWSAHGSTARGSESRTKLEVRNPSVGEGRLGLRESDGEEEDLVDVELGGRGKKLPEEEDGYTPLPTPTRVAPRSGRPLLVSNGTGFKFVLPEHPKQITSPPLESQILFVPIEDGSDIITPPRKSSYIQPKAKLKPKLQPRERYAEVGLGPKSKLPSHAPDGGNGAKGKLVKSTKARERSREMEWVNPHDRTQEDVEGLMLHREGEVNRDEALKKVEKIMQKGWLQRSMAG